MILAIDSSCGTSVAVVSDGSTVAECSDPNTRGHTEVIGVLLARALATAGVSPSDITCVAYGTGPGPFTGLRVGMAAGRAFAWARGIPEAGVLSHDAVALAVLEGAEEDAYPGGLQVATDARRRQLYVSGYSGLDGAGLPVRTSGPAVVDAAEAGTWLRAAEVSAGCIGLIAERRARAGIPQAGTAPVYLRDPDITRATGRKSVLQ